MKRALTVVAALAGCSIPEFVHPPGPPLIERFDVTPFELGPGSAATIRWRVRDAAEVTLEGAGDPRSVAGEGSLEVTLDRSTTFELIAAGPGGTSRARAEARVRELVEVEIIRFEVTPSLVEPGDPVRVVWRTEHSTRVVLRLSSGETLIDHAPDAGTLVFRPEGNVTIQLSAEGWPAPKNELRTVTAHPDGPMIVRFGAEPPIVALGDPIGLAWEISSADRVRVFEITGTSSTVLFDEAPQEPTGFLALSPTAGGHDYLLEASNELGVVLEAATAFILPPTPPQIVSFRVTPTITGAGGDITATWSTRFADRVQLWVNGQLLVPVGAASGVFILRRATGEVLTFELIAQDVTRERERRAAQNVVVTEQLPAVEALFAEPPFVAPGETVNVWWRTLGADSVTLSTDAGAVLYTGTLLGGDVDLSPELDVNLALAAENGSGTTIAYVPVRVLAPPQVLQFSSSTPVARSGRPIQFFWTTGGADTAMFSFEQPVEVSPNGSIRQYATGFGIVSAFLTVTNDLTSTSTVIGVQVIEAVSGDVEVEPNDSEPFAAGPYFTFPRSISGSVLGADVDLFELHPLHGDRMSLATTPPGGCLVGVALEVYEWNLQLGLLGPRLVVDGPNICAAADPLTSPILANLEPPIYVALRRPTGTSTIVEAHYQLEYSSETGICSDGIEDLFEECDDANVISGDGCSSACTVEGLQENEPNDGFATLVPIDNPVRGFLSYADVDRYRFQIDAANAGQRSILLEAPDTGACMLDAELVLSEYPSGAVLARDDAGGFGCPQLAGPATILTQGVYELAVIPGKGVRLPRKGRYVFSVR